MSELTREQVNELILAEGAPLEEMIGNESNQIGDVIRNKCKDIDLYQRMLDDDPMIMLEQPESSEEDWLRTGLNENVYKEIFLLLNKYYNNDSTYDKYINSFSKAFESSLIMYVINMYYEMLVKRLQNILKETKSAVGGYYNVAQGFFSGGVREEKFEALINKYGIDDIYSAYEEIKGLYEKKNPTEDKLRKVIYDSSNGKIVGFDCGDSSNYFSDNSNALAAFDSSITGVYISIAELRGVFVKHGINVNLNLGNSNFKKLRNSASHGEFEVNVIQDGLIIKNNGQVVCNVDDGNKNYFSTNFLRNLVDSIFEKIKCDDELSKRDMEVFSFLESLSNAMRSSDAVSMLPEIQDEEERQLMFMNLVRLSLFSTIQFNTQKFWRRLGSDSHDNYFKNILFLDEDNYSDKTRDNALYKSQTLFRPGLSFKVPTPDNKTVYKVFESIKNAIGHNNIDYSFGYLICRNDYEKYYENNLNGNNSYAVDGADFIDKRHRRIAFKVSDWMKFLASDNLFYAMARTPEEQEQIININK